MLLLFSVLVLLDCNQRLGKPGDTCSRWRMFEQTAEELRPFWGVAGFGRQLCANFGLDADADDDARTCTSDSAPASAHGRELAAMSAGPARLFKWLAVLLSLAPADGF